MKKSPHSYAGFSFGSRGLFDDVLGQIVDTFCQNLVLLVLGVQAVAALEHLGMILGEFENINDGAVILLGQLTDGGIAVASDAGGVSLGAEWFSFGLVQANAIPAERGSVRSI